DVHDKQTDAQTYGLEKPTATIQVTVEETKGEGSAKTTKTRTFTLVLGKRDTEKAKLYVQVAGRDRINAVEDSLLKTVQRPALAYRGRRVLDFNSAEVAKLEVQRGGEAYTLEQAKGVWRLTAPVQADIDATKAGQLL